ncbi:unnamed protein product [Parnassius mnemosyne]|uniref:Uncharacterized protein n=1 Tax=Parnassius mnemosyne TaxID=213953 RepID=A0AAV1KFY8_9NEOP
MDGTATKMKSFTQPKPMIELLPGIRSILTKDSIQTLTAKKQPRNTMALTRTSEKVNKPLTIAEMKTHLMALKGPQRHHQPNNSVKKKNWNSSVKVDKTISHTANGQLKHNHVRKMLNYSPKLKTRVNTTTNFETPKFHKPEQKVKQTLNLQGKSSVRISGVSDIAETPAIKNNPSYKNRMTLANKENYPSQANINTKSHTTPKFKPPLSKITLADVPDTPLSNISWKSSCDASFLQTEKALQDIEDKTKALEEEKTLENIAEVTPPVSTPFKEYRNVREFFNNTNDSQNSALYNDDTIMSFDKISVCKENSARDASVIVSLCELLNKAAVNNCDKKSSELDDLLEVEKQTERNIEMIRHGITTLKKIKESQMNSLQYIRKLIHEKRRMASENETEITCDQTSKEIKQEITVLENSSCSSRPCSVIKSCSKSPSYKIPKKNLCLRNKIIHKSMPNVSNGLHTPHKDTNNRALSIYMKMKEQMNFLNTPLVKHNKLEAPNTPAVTSHNLQMQLDKLYNS